MGALVPPFIPKKLFYLSLAVGGFLSVAIAILVTLFVLRAWWTTPFEVFGWGGPPEQPIAFPHTTHVQIDGINCAFCHRGVLSGDAATLPAVEQCLFCHGTIQGENAPPEIAKLVAYFNEGLPINWEKVHRLPDHVQFAHEPHIRFLTEVRGLEIEAACSTCHGEVRNMVEVEQVRRLKMGDCVDCHRENLDFTENKDITDCTACHY
jgi:hypothetical protein